MLEKINKPNDIHKIALADFPQLAEEIRQFLIESVSHTGGHLASNLGVVELTMALHNVLEFPEDRIVWCLSPAITHVPWNTVHKKLRGSEHDLIAQRRGVLHYWKLHYARWKTNSC